MIINKQDSKAIDMLRLPCAVLVVFIHVFSLYPGGGISRIIISQGVARVAVPVFFLTSGYLFFNGIEKWSWSLYGNKLTKRIKTLILPYLLWNTIFIIWFCLTLYASNGDFFTEIIEKRGGFLMYWNCNRFDYNPSINILGWQMWNGAFPINYPLWFIRDLIVINFCSPIVFLLIRSRWYIFLLFLFYLLDIWIPLEGFRAEGFFFFSLGGYLIYNKKGIVSTFSNRRMLIYALTAIFLILCATFYKSEYYMYFRRLLCLTGTISLFQITACFIRENTKVTTWLTKPLLIESSFVIFAAHAICFKPYVAAAFNRLLDYMFKEDVPRVLYDFVYFVTPIIISLIIIYLYYLLKSVSPRICSILTGGRNK